MKVFPKLFGLFAAIVSIKNAVSADSEKLSYVVSPSSGSEEFYLESNRLGAVDSEPHFGEDVVCEAIIRSPFFSVYNNLEILDPVNKNELLYADLYPKMRRRLLRKPYELVNVSVSQNVAEESVFSCVAKVKGTHELKLYLVSKEYDFNHVIRRPTAIKCPPTRSRFVFEYNERKNIAYLFAVADDELFDYMPIDYDHFKYFLKKDLNRIGESEEICRFSTGRKVRICAIALNIEEYRRNNISFLPHENKIEPDCEKKNLVFEDTSLHKLTEWVIGCRAEIVGKPVFATYFVSLGYAPYQFLVCHPGRRAYVHELGYYFYSHLGTDNSTYTGD